MFGEVTLGMQWQNGGTFAEYAAVPEAALAKKPSHVAFDAAAVVGTSGLIALQNLRAGGALDATSRVLVNGAGGGVGTLAVQIAKAADAHVTAVDRGDKLEALRSLGADEVVDYTEGDPLSGRAPFDVILDVASTLAYPACRSALTPTGKYVRVGHMHYEERRHRWFGNLPGFFAHVARAPLDSNLPSLESARDHEADLEILRGLLERGALTPVVDRVFALDEVQEAMAYLTSGEGCGRSVFAIP